MARILCIVGGALGHIGRVARVVDALEAARPGLEFEFVHKAPLNGPWVIDDRHPRRGYDVKLRIEAADTLEAYFEEIKPDLIVVDTTPVDTLLGVRWPAVPRVYVTNYFLTGTVEADTIQRNRLRSTGDRWNQVRRRRWLPPVRSVADLYEADHTIYCDPIGLVPDGLSRAETAVGPVSWEPAVPLPAALDDDRRIILATFGSTGRDLADVAHVEALRAALGSDAVIWAGRAPDEELPPGHEVHAMVPLQPLLDRCDAAVVQAGAGSTYAALAARVPVVLAPTSVNHGVLTDELVGAGAGLRLSDLEVMTSEAIRTAVAAARDTVGGLEIGEDGAARAAAIILERLDDGPPPIPAVVRLAAEPLDSPGVVDLPLPVGSEDDTVTPLPYQDGSLPSVWIPDARVVQEETLRDLGRVLDPNGHALVGFDHAGRTVPPSAATRFDRLVGAADVSMRVAATRITVRRRFARLPSPFRSIVARLVPGAAKAVAFALVPVGADRRADAAAEAALDDMIDREGAIKRRRSAGRVVLHIGTHKTGTTALQEFATRHADELEAAGVRYFNDPRSASPNATPLAMVAVRHDLAMRIRHRRPGWDSREVQDEMVEDVCRFVAATPPHQTILMSHEGLSFIRTAAEIDRLRSMLGGREVTVVLVTREPESFLRSYGAGIVTAPEFADGHDAVLGDLSPTSWLVDYDAMVGVWSDAFGAENVVHASYEEEIRRHRSTVPRVLRECGLTFDQLPGGWREHRNVTADP